MTSNSPSSNNDSVGRGAADEAELPALDWMRRAHAEDELLVEVARQVRRRRRFAVASGVLAAVMVGGLFRISVWRQSDETDPAPSLTATISRPERRILPDDSVVELKDGARMDIDYSDSLRRVTLRLGEAHFQVAKNMARPFVVEAAGVKVRAVGTAFSVQLGSKQVEVLVTEGQVQLAPLPGSTSVATDSDLKTAVPGADLAGPAIAQPIMGAGYRAIVSLDMAAPEIGEVSAAELADRLSWRIPSLEFSRTPLAEVVALMNRHGAGRQKVRFIIAGAELREVKLSGFLRADNSEGLVRLLESNFGVRAERSGDTITLRKAP